jgi:hypothetical protein
MLDTRHMKDAPFICRARPLSWEQKNIYLSVFFGPKSKTAFSPNYLREFIYGIV